MEAKIVRKSEEWKKAVSCECENLFCQSVEGVPVFEQLKLIFDDLVGQETDEKLRCRLVREYDLHVAIERGDIPHLSPTLKDSLSLCEKIAKIVPANWMDKLDMKPLRKAKYGFSERGEQAVFQVFCNCNATIVELQVRTENEEEEEILYWSKDKLFVIAFVTELDEEHSISMAQGHLFSL